MPHTSKSRLKPRLANGEQYIKHVMAYFNSFSIRCLIFTTATIFIRRKKMKKSIFVLLFIFISLVVITPELKAQPTCVEANGLLWCFNNRECGQACNDVCASLGGVPIDDDNVWFQAQDTLEECQAISQAFGLGNNVLFDSFTHGCLEDTFGDHTVGGGLNAPLTLLIF